MTAGTDLRGGHGLADLAARRVVVLGFARTGRAAARLLSAAGADVVVVDDDPGPSAGAEAAALRARLLPAPTLEDLRPVAAGADLVVVSPGVPPAHPLFALADPSRIVSEVELAGRLATVPVLAVTGTNGKTTVTALAAAMCTASGLSSAAAGNIGLPLVEAVTAGGADVVVAEVSSFQLAYTHRFRPRVAAWINLAEDHLDWHGSLAAYVEAKARIFANQQPGDVAVANADDPVTLERASSGRARLVTFGARHGDYRVHRGDLVSPAGSLGPVSVLARQMPHDIANALAAAAVALEGGATVEGCRIALAAWRPLAHRVAHVATVAGVEYFDDSKATTPSAVAAALSGFDDVVLIAGGRNKGLDLSALAAGAVPRPRGAVRGIVAIGEAAAEVAHAFRHAGCPVAMAASMDDAVDAAAALARPGQAVLLSPGCASFDWYGSYAERGDDFVRAVRRLAAGNEDGR